MNPYVLAFITIGPVCFIAGGGLTYFLFAGKSSPPPNNQTYTLKEIAMAVFAELALPLSDLATAVAALPANVATAVAAGDPQTAQDKADTIQAVSDAAKAATDAINSVDVPPQAEG